MQLTTYREKEKIGKQSLGKSLYQISHGLARGKIRNDRGPEIRAHKIEVEENDIKELTVSRSVGTLRVRKKATISWDQIERTCYLCRSPCDMCDTEDQLTRSAEMDGR